MTVFVTSNLADVVSTIVDNRGRTCPIAASGTPLIATNCVQDDSVYPVMDTDRYVSDETMSTWFRGHPEPHDILFVCKGSPGRVALVPNIVDFCFAQDMVALRADPSIAYWRYLYYLLSSRSTRDAISDLHVGTMIPHFKKGDFHQLKLRLHADLGEQRAIADNLGALDDRIAANKAEMSLCDQLAASLVSELTTGVPARPLREFAVVTMGTSPQGESMNETGEGISFFQGVRDFGLRTPSRRVYTSNPLRMADAGDVLLSVRAPVGRVNRAEEECCIGRGLASIRTTQGRNPILLHVLRQASDAWESFESVGTIFGSIGRNDLEMIEVPWPNAQEIDRILPVIDALENRLMAAARESHTLAALRDTLLPALMSGRLSVRDAEAAVSEVV